MTHLEVEEIASLAEGNVAAPEHEQFLKHIAQCEDCRKLYSTTLKFVERERTKKKAFRLPGFPKIEISQFLQSFATLFKNKILRPLPALALLILIMILAALHFLPSSNNNYRWWINKYGNYAETSGKDDPRVPQVQVVFERVKNAADKTNDRPPRLIIIDCDAGSKPFAMALPDNSIIINTETLDICCDGIGQQDGDSRLAFILGHELAHLAEKDFKHQKAFLSMEEYCAEKTQQELIADFELLDAKKAQQYKDEEIAADRQGALYAAMAGYDISPLFSRENEFLRRWVEQVGVGNFYDDDPRHPAMAKRIQYVRSHLQEVIKNVELFRTGVLLLQIGNFEDARTAFQEFEKVYPAREVYNNIGACFFNSAQYLLIQKFSKEYLRFRLYTAIDYSTTAERFRGTDSDKEEINKYLEKAIEYFNKAAKRDKIDKSCRYNLSAALILMEKYAKALEVCDSILDRDPRDVNALNNKAIALYYSNVKNPETARRAIGLLEKAYQLEPGKFEALYNLGSLKKTGARAYWEKYLKLPTIPRDDFYDYVYRKLKGTVPPPLKTTNAPKLPVGINIGMDFASIEEKLGKENTKGFDLDDFSISVLVKDDIRVVTLEGEVVILEKQLSKAEKMEKLLERFGPPQRVVRHSSGNFYVYENMGFSIKEVNGKARSYIWFEEE
ncbi:MAG: tetratricopeptide repeat protein [Candidatus Aminicenantes bacterium]